MDGISATLILDAAGFSPRDGRASSVLAAPMGTGSLLNQLLGAMSSFTGDHVFVVVSDDADDAYEAELRSCAGASASVTRADELGAILWGLETSDSVLILDPRHWPAEPVDFEAMFARRESPLTALHVVALEAAQDGTSEYVQLDDDGRVQRIRRYYSPMTRAAGQRGAVLCSLVPVSAVEGLAFTSLDGLRAAIAARGSLCHDVPVHVDPLDATTPHGLLAIQERTTARQAAADVPPGYSRLSAGVLVGRGALIHESARLVPPVILQDGVLIEEGATIIGPTLVGAGSTIQREAFVAQSLIGRGVTVPVGATVRQEAACSDGPTNGSRPAARSSDVEPAWNPNPPSESFAISDSGNGSGSPRRRGVRPDGPRSSFPGRTRSSSRTESVGDGRHGRRWYPPIKRLVDVAAAAVGLVVLSPLLALIAAAVRLDSRGPALFVHRRERGDGRMFGCLKFRTMRRDADRMQRKLRAQNMVDGPQFKMRDDPRVTRVGGWLRRTNLDELPQLINVLLGHMSLVGPRPSPFRENQICVPWRRARLSVRPGITGLWQICRSEERAAGDFQEWVYYDTQYVRHMSAWLDLKILVATFASFGGRTPVPISRLLPAARLAREKRQYRAPVVFPSRGAAERVGGDDEPDAPCLAGVADDDDA